MGYVLYVKRVPVRWKSKAQRSVTLSSTEAKWIALLESTKEIIFVLQLPKSLEIKVKLPITVRVDNTGAVFMSKNINMTSGTKHVDIRTKYANKYCDELAKIMLWNQLITTLIFLPLKAFDINSSRKIKLFEAQVQY